MSYSNTRQQPKEGYLEDIYDGNNWKWFENQMGPNDQLIGLQFCWDGADTSDFANKPFWPLLVSILNFPKDLRDKLNIGLHLVGLCGGKHLLI